MGDLDDDELKATRKLNGVDDGLFDESDNDVANIEMEENMEFEKLIKEYILKLLDYEETKLKCINLGWTRNETIKCEIKMLKDAKTLVKNKLIV